MFRGKEVVHGGLVYGYYFKIWNKTYILWGTTNGVPNMIEVGPETVGQFTGLQDKNGKDVYEGDIYMIDEYKIIVEIPDFFYNIESEMNSLEEKDIEIIGNIHEDQKLLNQNK